MGLLKKYRTVNSPPVEGWQAQPDGVVASCLHRLISLTTGRGRIKPPIEPAGQSAFQLSAPAAYEILFQQPHTRLSFRTSNKFTKTVEAE